MSNPFDLSAITLNQVLFILNKGLRIQPLIFVKSLEIFVEEVGDRGILSDPRCQCAENHPPLASKRQMTVTCQLSWHFPGWKGDLEPNGAQGVIMGYSGDGDGEERWQIWEGEVNESLFFQHRGLHHSSRERTSNNDSWWKKKSLEPHLTNFMISYVSWGTRCFYSPCGRMSFRASPPEDSWLPAHCAGCTLQEDAALWKRQLGCLWKGLSNFDSTTRTGEGAVGKRQGHELWEWEAFLPPSLPAYHGEITANTRKATRSCWHFPADSFLSSYTRENTRNAWLW